MVKTIGNSIQVTRGLEGVLESVAMKMYEDWGRGSGKNVAECQGWVAGTVKKILLAVELESATIRYRQMKLAVSMSGPMGEVSYISPKDRQPHGRRLPTSPYKETPKRLVMQEKMRRADCAWKGLDKNLKEEWTKAGRRIHNSGIGLYLGIYMSLLMDREEIPNPLSPTKELLKYYQKRKSRRKVKRI